MIITGFNYDEIAYLKITLSHRFAMKDLSVLRCFSGIEVAFVSNEMVV